MLNPVRFAVLLAFCAAVSIPSLHAQAAAQITGTVTDSSGSSVPGAKITVTSESTGVKSEATSNAAGNYTVLFLPPGGYRISAEKETSAQSSAQEFSCKWRRRSR